MSSRKLVPLDEVALSLAETMAGTGIMYRVNLAGRGKGWEGYCNEMVMGVYPSGP